LASFCSEGGEYLYLSADFFFIARKKKRGGYKIFPLTENATISGMKGRELCSSRLYKYDNLVQHGEITYTVHKDHVMNLGTK
jgi:hypothetical protein